MQSDFCAFNEVFSACIVPSHPSMDIDNVELSSRSSLTVASSSDELAFSARRSKHSDACSRKERLTLAEKLRIIGFYRTGTSQTELAARFNKSRTSISKLLRKDSQGKIQAMVVSGVRLEVRRCKHVRHPELERRVFHAVGYGTRMTSKAEILRKTVEIAKEMNVEEFERSDNWLARFINQHGLDTVLSRRGKNARVLHSLCQPCAEPTVSPCPSYTSCVSSSSSDSLPCAYFHHNVLRGNEALKEPVQFHAHETPHKEWRAIAPQVNPPDKVCQWQRMYHTGQHAQLQQHVGHSNSINMDAAVIMMPTVPDTPIPLHRMSHLELTTAQPCFQTTPATKDVLDELDKTFRFCWEEHFNDKWGWNGETGW